MTLEVGSKVPDFTLKDQDDNDVSIKDFKGKKVVVYFYPRDDTPGCTIQANDFTANIKELEKRNAVVLGISNDSVASHKKFVDKYDLKITLLADTEKEVVNLFGVFRPKRFMGREFLGIVRSTFIINEKGIISHVFPKVSPKKSISEVLAALDEKGVLSDEDKSAIDDAISAKENNNLISSKDVLK